MIDVCGSSFWNKLNVLLKKRRSKPPGGLAFSLRREGGALDWCWPNPQKRTWTTSEKDSYSSGPWHSTGQEVDEAAYNELLVHFGLGGRRDEFPLHRALYMSPSELARAGGKDPESYTIGDRRRASEVD
jgi:hypothetical protein